MSVAKNLENTGVLNPDGEAVPLGHLWRG